MRFKFYQIVFILLTIFTIQKLNAQLTLNQRRAFLDIKTETKLPKSCMSAFIVDLLSKYTLIK